MPKMTPKTIPKMAPAPSPTALLTMTSVSSWQTAAEIISVVIKSKIVVIFILLSKLFPVFEAVGFS